MSCIYIVQIDAPFIARPNVTLYSGFAGTRPLRRSINCRCTYIHTYIWAMASFGELRFGEIRFGEMTFGVVKFGEIRFGEVRFG